MSNLPANNNTAVLKSMLKAQSVVEEFDRALGKNRGVFEASLIELTSGDVNLQKCDPKLLVKEALRAATLNLPLSKSLGLAYIVAFNNSVKQPDGTWAKVMTPTFVVGYKGLIQLAMRTAQYKTLNADVVYEGELAGVDKLTGFVNLNGERTSDKVVGYFCHFELLNGFTKTLYVSVADMAKYAKKYSPSIRKDTTVEMLMAKAGEVGATKQVGWEGNFDDMALKTCVRRLLGKYGYLSVEAQEAFREEEPSVSYDDARAEIVNEAQEVVNLAEVDNVQQLPPQSAEPYVTKGMEQMRAQMAEATVFDANPDF